MKKDYTKASFILTLQQPNKANNLNVLDKGQKEQGNLGKG